MSLFNTEKKDNNPKEYLKELRAVCKNILSDYDGIYLSYLRESIYVSLMSVLCYDMTNIFQLDNRTCIYNVSGLIVLNIRSLFNKYDIDEDISDIDRVIHKYLKFEEIISEDEGIDLVAISQIAYEADVIENFIQKMETNNFSANVCAKLDCDNDGDILCEGCRCLKYCSNECEEKYKREHKDVCKEMKKIKCAIVEGKNKFKEIRKKIRQTLKNDGIGNEELISIDEFEEMVENS